MRLILILLLGLITTGSAHAQTQTDSVLFNPGFPDSLLWSIDSSLKADANLVYTGKVILGTASFYSAKFEGIKTASGDRFSNKLFTGASNSLPLGTWVKVTNIKNGKYVVVRINDKMHPKMKKRGRVIDLSRSAAEKLQYLKKGLAKVKLEVVLPPDVKNN
ncbi:septal ring lytic transglycosylase RlpA family protein [Sediminibacterium sp.]|uniref:septal ring lytic transglycosylase RlpA family protein n=1 Tax=Sediminibacterium sp. TaxID=1917865 RepID=UPI003F6E7430